MRPSLRSMGAIYGEHMKKGIILYYSNTGNTKLICELLQKKLSTIEFTIMSIFDYKHDIKEQYDVFGFACFTDQLGIPKIMKSFFSKIRTNKKSYSFVFNTYGSISGRTLLELTRNARRNGYTVIDGISIHVPENYPPMIKRGLSFINEPSENELQNIKLFIERLYEKIEKINENTIDKDDILRIEFKQKIIPLFPKVLSKFELGEMECKINDCIKCGLCTMGCPAKAITLVEFPVFDYSKCQHCWKCYNLCPKKAIRASKFGEGHYYSRMNESYKQKIQMI